MSNLLEFHVNINKKDAVLMWFTVMFNADNLKPHLDESKIFIHKNEIDKKNNEM